MCSQTAYADDPNHHQKASSFQHSTPAFLKLSESGLDNTTRAATNTQEPRFPDCLHFPKCFGPRPNCQSSTGLRTEAGMAYPLPAFKLIFPPETCTGLPKKPGLNLLHFFLHAE